MTPLSYSVSGLHLDERISQPELTLLNHLAPNVRRGGGYFHQIRRDLGEAEAHLDDYVKSHYGEVHIKGPLTADMSKSPLPGAKHIVAAYVGEPRKGGYLFADSNIETKVKEFGTHHGLSTKAAGIYVLLHELGHAYHGHEEIRAEAFVDMVARYIAQRIKDPQEKAMYMKIADAARNRFNMAKQIDGKKRQMIRREQSSALYNKERIANYLTMTQAAQYDRSETREGNEETEKDKRKKKKDKKKEKGKKSKGGKK
ncbi:hypothetical protein J4410_03650 [Candidatus Woesearchaeota archaeon]|nr:hypothetical protein [Candidatus Woesearchaeota archaeon]